MSLLKSLDNLSSSKSVRKAWLWFAILFFILIIVIPSIFVMTKLITDWDTVTGVFGNAESMDLIKGAIWNSFSIAILVTLIDIVAGLPMAWIMVRKEFKGKKILDTWLDIPLAFPTAVLGISVVMFWCHPESVPIPGLGLEMSTFMAMILLHIVFTYPYMVRTLSGILEQIDPNYETAAMTLGASKWTAVRTITLPLFRVGLATGFILCFSRSLSETGGTYIALKMLGVETTFFTGPSYIAYESMSGESGDPIMVVISILMIVFALILLLAVHYLLNRTHVSSGKVFPNLGRIISNGILPKAKDVLTYAFFIIVVLLPSFYIFMYLTQPIPGIDYGELGGTMVSSFIIAGAAVVVDIIIGIPMALYIARNKSSKLAKVLDSLVNVPLIVPTTALGFSLALFWHSLGTSDSFGLLLVTLGHIAFTYPLVVRNLTAAIEEVNPEAEEIAMTLGAKPLQAFRKVLSPVIKTAVISGAIMAFTRSLGETGATVAISNSVNTVPVYITNLINLGPEHYAEAAMCSIVLIVVCFILLFVVRKVSYRRNKSDA